MKNIIVKNALKIVIVINLILTSCLNDNFNTIKESVNNPTPDYEGFNFATIKDYTVDINFLDANDNPLSGVYVELYSSNPFAPDGTLIQNQGQNLLFKGNSDENGILKFSINSPTYADSIFIYTKYTGLPEITVAPVISDLVQVTIGGSHAQTKSVQTKVSYASPVSVNGYYAMGTWNSLGVPTYMEGKNDEITKSLLDDITASLPEFIPLTQSHPQYLENTDDGNLVLEKDCEIWVTFVHEGAGWLNVLGFYTYKTGDEPQSRADIKDLTVIFPNVSFAGSGGGLVSGNKVQLKYYDPATKLFTTVFPAGITVGWFIIAQGWKNTTVTSGAYSHYSNLNLNIETDPKLRKHNVLLYDNQRNLLLMGFEDIRRDQGSDNDFNDAVFYATLNPVSAVNKERYKPIDKPVDTDSDGISDIFDDYPNDASKAHDNFYPAVNKFGTLAYEDLWPSRGDYDFNDLVLDYNFHQVTNASNLVMVINSKIKVRAIGASYHNAFAIEFGTSPSNVQLTTGQKITKNYLSIQSNGTENGQSKASIVYFDDAYNALNYPGYGLYVNTLPESPYENPTIQVVNINFINPVSSGTLGTPPYNPYLIVDRIRGKEIHLPDKTPTDLADRSLLGTGDDNSNPNSNKYYVSDKYLPWCINFPQSFDYPVEKKSITDTYLHFTEWAESKGVSYPYWYQDKEDYRNTDNIY